MAKTNYQYEKRKKDLEKKKKQEKKRQEKLERRHQRQENDPAAPAEENGDHTPDENGETESVRDE